MISGLDWRLDACRCAWHATAVLPDWGVVGNYTLLPMSVNPGKDIAGEEGRYLWVATWLDHFLIQGVTFWVARARCQRHYEDMIRGEPKERKMSEQQSADLYYVITNTDGDVDLTVHTLESLLRFLNREDYDASDEEPEDHLALCVQPGEMPGVGEQMDLSAGFRVGYSSKGGWPRKEMLIIRGHVVAPEPVTEVTRWGVKGDFD